VFLTYAAPRGHTFLDRALYLPQPWTDDAPRCRAAGVPETVSFQTKPHQAQAMLARARKAGVPFGWVTADCVYGADPGLRHWLEAQAIAYVLAIRKDTYLAVPHATGSWRECIQTLVARLPAAGWTRLSAGAGSKGPRWYDWTRVLLAEPAPAGWATWLLVRRSLAAPSELAYYHVCAPGDTDLAALATVAGTRWTVEECFEAGKNEVGLDEYEVRRWDAWHRHITLAMLAHAYLTVVQASSTGPAPVAKGGALLPPTRLSPMSVRTHRTCCR